MAIALYTLLNDKSDADVNHLINQVRTASLLVDAPITRGNCVFFLYFNFFIFYFFKYSFLYFQLIVDNSDFKCHLLDQ